MKIIIVGPANPYRGGIAIFNETLAKNLTHEGHHVEIINFTLQYPSFLFPGKTQYTDATAPTEFPIKRMLNSINPLSWFAVARHIRRQSPDLVILRYWMPFFAPSLGLIARRLKTPTVVLADNIIPHEPRFYDRPFTRYLLRGVDAVLYMSAQVGEELDQFHFKGLKKFSPHPIYDNYGEAVTKEEACRELGLDPEYNYSLFFGFIREYKGLDLLLQAWSMLDIIQEKRLRLIIAGEFYGNREHYLGLIHRLGIGESVIIHDHYIPEKQVRHYFCASDLVIQPYRTATQSGVTQIAYHFGTPMIVTNVGGLAEIVPHNRVGYVVEQSSDQLRDVIKEFYVKQRGEEFRQNIIKERLRFQWSKMTNAFLELYSQLTA